MESVITGATGSAAYDYISHQLGLYSGDSQDLEKRLDEIRSQNDHLLQILHGTSVLPKQPVPTITLDPLPDRAAPQQSVNPPSLPAIPDASLLNPPVGDVPPCVGGMDPIAAMRRAVAFDQGYGLPHREADQAAACYGAAGHAGMPEAQYALADMLLTGDDGVPRDPQRAMEWLQDAADLDFVPAYVRLALAYEHGEAGPPDSERAAYWYLNAAAAGEPYSQMQLSRFAWFGVAGPPNRLAAFGWLELALEEGYAPAGPTMRQMLDVIAADAHAGSTGAAYVMGLGAMYGVPGLMPVDDRNAAGWLSMAARDRSDAAAVLRELCGENPAACPNPP
jgi:TPR repeat protein